MSSFYVFYGPPRRRARVHRGDCPHCNEGHGQKGQDRKADGPTQWFGPFSTQAEALGHMKTLDAKDAQLCAVCR